MTMVSRKNGTQMTDDTTMHSHIDSIHSPQSTLQHTGAPPYTRRQSERVRLGESVRSIFCGHNGKRCVLSTLVLFFVTFRDSFGFPESLSLPGTLSREVGHDADILQGSTV